MANPNTDGQGHDLNTGLAKHKRHALAASLNNAQRR